eukprot:GHVN01064780.1.p1 GENE.GHVN01064780.1~~GHVN01064780.1.p1  ORF type:complete len:278 (-),score=22.42 GHVN01064780.1:317-1150(-)
MNFGRVPMVLKKIAFAVILLAPITLILIRLNFSEILNATREPRDADGCYHVFLDVGANIGVHGRFLFEPEQYPKALSRKVFNAEFGYPRDNRDFCVFEIEANPQHLETLKKNSKTYETMGWRYHVMNVGVSHHYGTMDFYHNRRIKPTHKQASSNKLEVGFGIKDKRNTTGFKAEEAVSVPVIRFASWLAKHVNQREIPETVYGDYGDRGPTVVAKMDIEGSEYIVLPDLMLSGALCGIDFLFGEFHARFAPTNFYEQQKRSRSLPEGIGKSGDLIA